MQFILKVFIFHSKRFVLDESAILFFKGKNQKIMANNKLGYSPISKSVIIIGLACSILCGAMTFQGQSQIKFCSKSEPLPIILLGQRLFFDTRLSANGTKSCATCHEPTLAFTDGYRRSAGLYADMHRHNAPSLLNLDTYSSLNWSDPNLKDLGKQIEGPLFGEKPIEMGALRDNSFAKYLIEQDTINRALYIQAFGSSHDYWNNLITSLAQYVSQLVSRNAPYDRFAAGDTTALTHSQKMGMALFFSPRLGCVTCHGGKDFNQYLPQGTINGKSAYLNFHCIGLYPKYPDEDRGLVEITHIPTDHGKFRTPSLRNIVLTAPYMHDGSISFLQECFHILNSETQSSTTPEEGINTLIPERLTPLEQKNLIAFLNALTDTTYLKNPLFNPPVVNH